MTEMACSEQDAETTSEPPLTIHPPAQDGDFDSLITVLAEMIIEASQADGRAPGQAA